MDSFLRCFSLASVCVLFLTVDAYAGIIAEYDAGTGNPASAAAVVDPGSAPGGSWTDFDPTLGGSDAQEGVLISGTPAWRNLDGTDGNNPGYLKTISAGQYSAMFANGWVFTTNLQMVQGGQFSAWGTDSTGGPWAGVRERAGASFDTNGTTTTITPVGGPGAFTAGPDEAFYETRLEGAGGSTRYRFFINDVFYGSYDFADGSSNTSNDNLIGWQSGSSGGSNREGNWNLVRLKSNDYLASEVFYDNFSSYATNGSGPITDSGFTSTWEQFGTTGGTPGSRIFSSAGGGAFNSNGWITASLGGIRTDVEAMANADYQLSMILAAEVAADSSSTDWAVTILLGQDFNSAVPILTETGTDSGSGPGKFDSSNHQLFYFSTDGIAAGDRLFIQIERTGGNAFLFVDDVFLTSVVPEPSALCALGIGALGLGLVCWRRRRHR